MFKSLNIEYINTDSTCNLQRKSSKKLKEIDELKIKTNLSNDEISKINLEEYWKNILNPQTRKHTTIEKNNYNDRIIKKRIAKQKRVDNQILFEKSRETQLKERLKIEQ